MCFKRIKSLTRNYVQRENGYILCRSNKTYLELKYGNVLVSASTFPLRVTLREVNVTGRKKKSFSVFCIMSHLYKNR